MARAMIGAEELTIQPPRSDETGGVRLELDKVCALDDAPGVVAVNDVSLAVRGGEIVGVASMSGNRPASARRGALRPARGRERRNPRCRRCLSCETPEEKCRHEISLFAGGRRLKNACVGGISAWPTTSPFATPRALFQGRLVAETALPSAAMRWGNSTATGRDRRVRHADIGTVSGGQSTARGAGARIGLRCRGADCRHPHFQARLRGRHVD